MREERRVGRPRSVSRATLEEAACELFLEQGYAATSVADITRRAGVSRATFFNYIPTKSDLLWTSVDDALDRLATRLSAPPLPAEIPDLGEKGPQKGPRRAADAEIPDLGGEGGVRGVLLEVAEGLEPGTVVLAFANAEPMGVSEELEDSAARRQVRAAAIIADHLRRRGLADLDAEVLGAALSGAFLAALRTWARSGPGQTPFTQVLRRALDVLTR